MGFLKKLKKALNPKTALGLAKPKNALAMLKPKNALNPTNLIKDKPKPAPKPAVPGAGGSIRYPGTPSAAKPLRPMPQAKPLRPSRPMGAQVNAKNRRLREKLT